MYMNNGADMMGMLFGIQKVVNDTLWKATHFDELDRAIMDFIAREKGLEVWRTDDGQCGVHKHGLEVFRSVSYAACIEWALKQPNLTP